MGVDIVTWRLRIGQKGNYGFFKAARYGLCSVMRINASTQGCPSFRACVALSLLLFMAGIELNPGPVTCYELAGLINNLTTQVNTGFQQCNAKLDAFVADVTELKASFTALELKCHTEIAALKTSLEKVTKELADVKSSGASAATHWPTLQAATATPPLSTITDLAKEMKLRDAKQLNVIVHGLPPAPDDCAAFCTFVNKEFGLSPHIQSVKRLTGKAPARDATGKPAPLLVVLRDADDRRILLKNAPKLRASTDAAVKASVYINPDLTQMERQEGFALRSELRRRKAAGEVDIAIRKGVIVKLSAASAAAPRP